jgi:hypothetical protein
MAAVVAPELGVFVPDRARSIIAISDDGELGVALHDTVDPALVLVRNVRPDECSHAIAACRPWPFLVVSAVHVPPAVQELVRTRPVLCFRYGDTATARAGVRCFSKFGDLVHSIDTALHAHVDGMRLAYGAGVDVNGRWVASAALEALIAAHPHGFELPLRIFRNAAHKLVDLGVRFTVARDPNSGNAVLRPGAAQPAELMS